MMMRYLFALLLSILAGSVAYAAGRDWATIARVVPAGGYVVGNPAAKVKLVEYVSYTCPHCRHFNEDSSAVLEGQMVRSGSASVEVRNQIHDKLDLVAVVLSRCIGAAGFPKYHDAVFARQEDWFARAEAFDTADGGKTGTTLPAKARALADGSGLSEIAKAAGMSAATLDRCFADQAAIDRAIKASAAIREDVRGTPTFELNGTLIGTLTWADLEPRLRAAGAK